jgi:hypothetical protein
MDYIDHLRFDPNQTVEVPIDPDVRRARSVDDRGPQRPPNDYYGLNYLTLAPADRPRDYAPEDQQAIYHGYQALSPRKQPKVTADPNAPLNM